MSLRIVHVVRQYAPSVGGLETVVARLASLQKQRFGYDVSVVTLDRVFKDPDVQLDAQEIVDGIPVVRLPWRGSTRYPWCPRILGAIAGADLVHVHGIDFFYDFLAATRWLHGRPLVASTHGGFFHTDFASTLKRVWFQTITRLSSLAYRRVFATSENDGVVFRGVAGSRVVVIENGADLERNRDASPRAAMPTMIFFGRWSANKGIDRTLALFAQLHALDDRWRLIVAGRPYDLSRADIAGQAEALGIAGSTQIDEAPSDVALRAHMASASYFVCLSRHEGFGIAAIEAMTAGLVPVLGDIPPFRKIVRESGCGLVVDVPASSVDDMRAAARAVQSLHTTATTDGHAQRARCMAFAERYDWAGVVSRFDTQYREVVAPARFSRSSVST